MYCSIHMIDGYQHLVSYWMTLLVSVFLSSLSKTTTIPLDISSCMQSIINACRDHIILFVRSQFPPTSIVLCPSSEVPHPDRPQDSTIVLNLHWKKMRNFQ